MNPVEQLAAYRRLTLEANLVTPPPGFNRRVPYTSATHLRAAWEDYLASPANAGHNALYVHVPFCVASKCRFCMYWSSLDPSPDAIRRYLRQLEEAAAFYAPLFASRHLEALYIGGGTPSLLVEAELDRLFTKTISQFHFQDCAERTMEQSFRTTSAEKLDLVRRAGITRLSFGLQSVERAVLDAVGRAVAPEALVKDLLAAARVLGFHEINVDLMIGLPGETQEGIIRAIDLIVAAGAHAITVYVHRHLAGTPGGLPAANLLERFNLEHIPQMLTAVREAAASAGFVDTVADDNSEFHFFASREHLDAYALTPYRTRFDAHCGNSVLGLGHTAISYVLDLFRAEYRRPSEEFDPHATSYAIDISTPEQRRRLYVAETLSREGAVDDEIFQTLFGVPFGEAFACEVEALESLGGLRLEGTRYSIVARDRLEFAALSKYFWDQDYLREAAISP